MFLCLCLAWHVHLCVCVRPVSLLFLVPVAPIPPLRAFNQVRGRRVAAAAGSRGGARGGTRAGRARPGALSTAILQHPRA